MYVSAVCEGCGYLIIDNPDQLKEGRCICIRYWNVPYKMYAENNGMGEKHTIYGRLRICTRNNERDLFTIKRDERKTSRIVNEHIASTISSVSTVCNKE